ncbi:hypothetical protein PDE_08108 [Penicillium oxalicum 114-2]|uniref:Uncharacterized protein n=1 Tax=Penicillium oxalicum (strain 114-2 / CGMCC 5302) TaxID=933388 RepID=S7ZWJ2_PENO1|nr:hypothetical protein PDE_08108 [Penicillium oxalicum 114-2]
MARGGRGRTAQGDERSGLVHRGRSGSTPADRNPSGFEGIDSVVQWPEGLTVRRNARWTVAGFMPPAEPESVRDNLDQSAVVLPICRFASTQISGFCLQLNHPRPSEAFACVIFSLVSDRILFHLKSARPLVTRVGMYIFQGAVPTPVAATLI